MNKKTKSFFLPTIYLLILFSLTIGIYLTKKFYDSYDRSLIKDNITYVSSSILNRSVPIINNLNTIGNPFSKDNITISRYYYHKDDSLEDKEKSIVYYEGSYMPNTGIDYTSDEVFDVLAVYDGTVIDVNEDELLGKSVKIRHNNDVISVYQGLDNVEVLKGEIIYQGQKIATSGRSIINKDLGNHLHFEIYVNGETKDPITCIGKEIGDI